MLDQPCRLVTQSVELYFLELRIWSSTCVVRQYWLYTCKLDHIPLPPSLMPRPHPRGEEKGSGYNTTSRQTLEGRNQHTIVNDHVLTYAIYGILSMPCGPHCGAYYSNCTMIGHSTCQMAYVTGSDRMSYCNQALLREGGVWARDILYCHHASLHAQFEF